MEDSSDLAKFYEQQSMYEDSEDVFGDIPSSGFQQVSDYVQPLSAMPSSSTSKGCATLDHTVLGNAHIPRGSSILSIKSEMQTVQAALLTNFESTSGKSSYYLRTERAKMRQTLHNAFKLKLSASMVVIDPVGVGKALLVDDVLRDYNNRIIQQGGNNYVAVVNGLVTVTDSEALVSITNQLMPREKKGRLQHATAQMDLENHFRLCRTEGNPAVIVLEEFYVFADKRRQTLIYSLLDLMHKSDMLFIMIGITGRADVTLSLEKRVLSRLNAQYIYISHASAEAIARDLYTRLILPGECVTNVTVSDDKGPGSSSNSSSSGEGRRVEMSRSHVDHSGMHSGRDKKVSQDFRIQFNKRIVELFGEYTDSHIHLSEVKVVEPVDVNSTVGALQNMTTDETDHQFPVAVPDVIQSPSQKSHSKRAAQSTPLSSSSARKRGRGPYEGRFEVSGEGVEIFVPASPTTPYGTPARVSRSTSVRGTPVSVSKQVKSAVEAKKDVGDDGDESDSGSDSSSDSDSSSSGGSDDEEEEGEVKSKLAVNNNNGDMPVLSPQSSPIFVRTTRGGSYSSPPASQTRTVSPSQVTVAAIDTENSNDKKKHKKSSGGDKSEKTSKNRKAKKKQDGIMNEYKGKKKLKKSDGALFINKAPSVGPMIPIDCSGVTGDNLSLEEMNRESKRRVEEEEMLKAERALEAANRVIKPGSLLRVIQTHREWGQGVEYFNRVAKSAVFRLTEAQPYITRESFLAAMVDMEPVTIAEEISTMDETQRMLLAALAYLHLHTPSADYFTVGQLVIEFKKFTGWLADEGDRIISKLRVLEAIYQLCRGDLIELYNHQFGSKHMVTDSGTDAITNQTVVFLKCNIEDVRNALLNKSHGGRINTKNSSNSEGKEEENLVVTRPVPLIHLNNQNVHAWLTTPSMNSLHQHVSTDLKTSVEMARLL